MKQQIDLLITEINLFKIEPLTSFKHSLNLTHINLVTTQKE